MASPLKVAVIGAGVAGLAAARALKNEGHLAVIYEKSDKLGGTWVYDPQVESDPLGLDPNRETVHSSLYHSLRTNLPRQLMGFSDYPFSTDKNGDPRTFPGREEVLEFLNEFATHFGLVELIRFQTKVDRVERVDHRWVVESSNNESTSNDTFDAVAVCNGHFTQPIVANFPGREKWPGKQIHSHNYRVPDPFKDQIVVVIGEGPSGTDIAVEISSVAKQVHLSSRSPQVKISKLDFRDNMWQHSKIDYVDVNGEVVFQDGGSIYADIILHCTGFKYDFPFLKTDGIVSVEDNRVGPLYKHVFPPKLAPTLSFVGLTSRTPIFPGIDLQTKWVARVLSGKARLPSAEEMAAEVKEYYRDMEAKGIPKHYTHSLAFEFDYVDWLANQVGSEGIIERLRSTVESYVKFVIDHGMWRHKEWEPCSGTKENEGGLSKSIEKVKLSST
ncbi:hypothetical protein ACS0TY_028559 [Phlomoides rotata]